MLACPDIWVADVLTFPNVHAVETILDRARQLPLDIALTASTPARSAAWYTSLCFQLLPRIRNLKLSMPRSAIDRDDFNELVRSMISQGAPVLQSLDIVSTSTRRTAQFPDLEFFAPSLRSLRLDGVYFSCLSATLTFVHLTIGRPALKMHHLGADVLDVLRGSPETLEHVCLEIIPDMTRGQTIAVGAFGEDVHLSNAKSVSFRGTDTEILRPLQLPPGAFVYISLDVPVVGVVEDADDILLARILVFLLTDNSYALSLGAVRGHTHLSFQSLPPGMPHGDAHTLTTHAQKVARDVYHYNPTGSGVLPKAVEPGLLLEWHPPVTEDQRTAGEMLYILLELVRYAISALFSENDLFEPIKCLDLCVTDDLLAAEWAVLLKDYMAVDTLRMHIASTNLLAALATQTSTLLPNLTTLVLVLDSMDDAEDYREHQRVEGLVETLERLVLGHLAAGRDSSIEYVRLELEESSNARVFAEMAKERLRVYVPHVEVTLSC